MRVIAFILLSAGAAMATNWRDQAILNLEQTPHAKLHPVPVRAVKLADGFWKSRQTVTEQKSIPTLLNLLEENGVVDNFRRLSGQKNVPRKGPLYTDSDLYKWTEAAAWALHNHDNPKLRAEIGSLVKVILAAQEPSGYLNTYWVEDRAKDRFRKMQSGHELYCLGHMLQAGIALYRATGDRSLLDGGIRFVDYLVRDFGPTKRPLLTGHPELELALVELYRVTGRREYLELAGYLLSGVETERLHLKESEVRYMFSGIPFTSRTRWQGHAVRAMYAATGAADYYMETGDPAYRKTLDVLWDDLARRQMYITGGVGTRAAGEAFGEAYELPNAQAYTESCAAIGNFIYNQRMLAMTGDAKYADIMERALYNGINSGMSLDGALYCYRNPLASNGEKIRNPWYNTTCCPPNIQRIFMALSGYFFSTSREGLYAHFYDNAALDWKLENGTPLRLEEKTGAPWNGNVAFSVEPAKPAEFTLFLRIPSWSLHARVLVNGKPWAGPANPNTYLPLRRTWKAGDKVNLELDMTPRFVKANPRIPEDFGKAAVQRGPFIYCAEQQDQDSASVHDLVLSEKSPLVPEQRANFLGGVTVLKQKGLTWQKPLTGAPLYSFGLPRPTKAVDLLLIPYFAWANREPAPMTVWLFLSPQDAAP